MRKRILTVIAVLAASAIVTALFGCWWIGLRGTGTLDDGVAVLNEHHAQMIEILHIAAADRSLDMVLIYDFGKAKCDGETAGNGGCARILRLMRAIPIRDVAFLRDADGGKLKGADFVLFKGTILRRPVEVFWGVVQKVHPDDRCKEPVPDWRVCPGDFGWM